MANLDNPGYLKGTTDIALKYEKGAGRLLGYSDADWNGITMIDI